MNTMKVALALVALLALVTVLPAVTADVNDALENAPSIDRAQAPRPSCDVNDPDPVKKEYCRTYTSFWIAYDAYLAPIDAITSCMTGGPCPPDLL